MVRERADRLLNDLLDAATLSAIDAGETEGEPNAGEKPTDGNGKARSGAASPAQA